MNAGRSIAGQKIAEYSVANLASGLSIAAHVRVAGTSKERRQGLMGIDRLAQGSGLWIAPCEAIHTFGMKTPIDALFLDSKFRVKKLLPDLRPRRLSVCLSASSVLEVEAGSIVRSGTKVGDPLAFEQAAGPRLEGSTGVP